MNERIEEYLEEHLCLYYVGEHGYEVKDPHYFIYREDVEGLIELVVKECANIAYEVGLHRQTKHEILRRFELEVTDEN
jgi:hypothetical protein